MRCSGSPFFVRLLRYAYLGPFVLILTGSVPAAVTTDSTFLLVDGKRTFLIGSYDIPPGLSVENLREAGFNFYFESLFTRWSSPRPRGLWWPEHLGSALLAAPAQVPWLIETVTEQGSAPGLLVWHGPDEPAWQGVSRDYELLEIGYGIVRTHDTYFSEPHPIWINHACRGTQAHPDSFELLRPYFTCADVFSMDIYPVPASYDHSILPNKTLSCVGEHVDILIDLLSQDGRQQKPAWMVLQGFSWTDFNFSQEWYGAQRSVYDFEPIAYAASGDVTGDGLEDLMFLVSEEDGSGHLRRADVARSTSTTFLPPAAWRNDLTQTLSGRDVCGADCADVTGDGLSDLALWTHDGDEGTVDIAVSLGTEFDSLRTWFASPLPILDPDHASAFGLADVDGDGLADVVLASSVDSLGAAEPGLWAALSRGDHLGPLEGRQGIRASEIPLDRIEQFRYGDFDGDGTGDVCFFVDDGVGSLSFHVSLSDTDRFAPETCWWDTSSVEFPMEAVSGLTVQDLDGDERDDLLLFYSQRDNPYQPQWLVALLSDGSRFHTERWGVCAIGNFQFADNFCTVGGDFNGDGFGDFAMLHNRTIPEGDPYHVIRVGLSYGEKFGVPGPSYEQSRFMAYDAAIHGATGILWWGLWYTGGPYAVWQGISEVARELRALSAFLVCDDAPDSLEVIPAPVEARLKRTGSYVCLIAANRADSTLDASFSALCLEDFSSLDVLWEDRSVPCGAAVHDRFGPHEVHVYLGWLPPEVDPVPPPGRIDAWPNPFSTTTSLRVRTDRPEPVSIDIHDIRGRRVRRLIARNDGAGLSWADWDGRDEQGKTVAAGVYLCRFRIGDGVATRKIVRIR